jgi:PEP-CTERM motif-containing protein
MKTLTVLAVAVLGVATLAKADSRKPDDGDANAIQSFRSMNRHHPHGFHLKLQKDDNDPGIDLDDFAWVGPNSKSVENKSETRTAHTDISSASGSTVIATGQDVHTGDDDSTKAPSTVPEPATIMLLATGFFLLFVSTLRVRSKSLF